VLSIGSRHWQCHVLRVLAIGARPGCGPG
jgi:hypothetical protein